jgi:SAM-dependent methyltransferase
LRIKLARYYGYESASDLANSLPVGARIIDIGAGISDFGRVIASMRPDVAVTYFDLRYNNAELLAKAQGDKVLQNVSYMQGDILEIEQSPLKLASYDRVFSSRLIPHIDLEDVDLARKAISNMGKLLNPDGEMMILCRFGPLIRDKLLHHPSAVKITNRELQEDADSTINKTLSDIRLPDIHRVRQRMWNISGTDYFRQAQWRQPDKKGRLHPMRGDIWDPINQRFVRRIGLRGQMVHAGFWNHATRDSINQRSAAKK